MDFHKLDAKGKIWIQRLATRPDPPTGSRAHHNPVDTGRIFYVEDEARFLFGSSVYYEPWGADIFPLYTQCVFYQNSAPAGWEIRSTVTDALILFPQIFGNP